MQELQEKMESQDYKDLLVLQDRQVDVVKEGSPENEALAVHQDHLVIVGSQE